MLYDCTQQYGTHQIKLLAYIHVLALNGTGFVETVSTTCVLKKYSLVPYGTVISYYTWELGGR